MMSQYTWQDGHPLTTYSTAAVRMLQNQHIANDHPTIRKWEVQLQTRLPEHIWHNTWLPFRSAKENFFLWQIIYRAIATLSWVFPNRPHSDSVTWCPRCPLPVREDILHCLWQCPSSQECWNWIGEIVTTAAGYTQRVPITAARILLATAFPNSVELPFRLWQILRASMCWQLWKASNECVFSHLPWNSQAVIRKTWYRLSSHLRLEWKQQLADIRSGKQNREEARASMKFHFGIEGVAWELENFNLQVPPCPPRPP